MLLCSCSFFKNKQTNKQLIFWSLVETAVFSQARHSLFLEPRFPHLWHQRTRLGAPSRCDHFGSAVPGLCGQVSSVHSFAGRSCIHLVKLCLMGWWNPDHFVRPRMEIVLSLCYLRCLFQGPFLIYKSEIPPGDGETTALGALQVFWDQRRACVGRRAAAWGWERPSISCCGQFYCSVIYI